MLTNDGKLAKKFPFREAAELAAPAIGEDVTEGRVIAVDVMEGCCRQGVRHWAVRVVVDRSACGLPELTMYVAGE